MKRQRTCEQAVDARLDQAITLVQRAAADVRTLSDPAEVAAAMSGLKSKVGGLRTSGTAPIHIQRNQQSFSL